MSTTRRLILQSVIAGGVAGVLLLSAFGLAQAQWGDPAPAPEPTPTPTEEAAVAPPSSAQPCDLVTQAEAEAALATPTTTTSDLAQCTYLAADISGRAISVALTGDLPDGEGVLESAMQQLAAAIGGTATRVDVGREAFAVTSDVMAQLAVRAPSGDVVMLVLTIPDGTADQVVARMADLARPALDRL